MNPTWNRRTFLTALGLSTAATTLPASARLRETSRAAPTPSVPGPALAFVSTVNFMQGGISGITTFRIHDGRWTEIAPWHQTYHPGLLAPHPTLPVLYTPSGPLWAKTGDARRGIALALAIDPSDSISVEACLSRQRHWINEINRQPLALTTTQPSSIAVSPDARFLLIADRHAGTYNILPLAPDGALLPLEHALKLTGSSQSSPHPHSVLFHPRGHLAYATDQGTDRLHVICFDTGHPRIVSTLAFALGSAPTDLALHPSNRFLLVSTGRGGLCVLPIDHATGDLSSEIHPYSLADDHASGPILLHIAGDRLYIVTSPLHPERRSQSQRAILHTLRFSRSGRLSPLARTSLPGIQRGVQLAFAGSDLVLVGDGGIVTVPLDPDTRLPGAPVLVHIGKGHTGIVVRSA